MPHYMLLWRNIILTSLKYLSGYPDLIDYKDVYKALDIATRSKNINATNGILSTWNDISISSEAYIAAARYYVADPSWEFFPLRIFLF